MELEEVEMVRAQALQRALEFRFRLRARVLAALAGEEGVLAVRLQRRAELHLRVAIGGRDVEVVDAAFHRPGHGAVRLALLRLHHHDPAEADDRKFDPVPAVGAARQFGGVAFLAHGIPPVALPKSERDELTSRYHPAVVRVKADL